MRKYLTFREHELMGRQKVVNDAFNNLDILMRFANAYPSNVGLRKDLMSAYLAIGDLCNEIDAIKEGNDDE